MSMQLEQLLKIAAFDPKSLEQPNAWVGHLPFAAWVMQEAAPKIFVELGSHSGNSYFSFCQSALENYLPTKCFAVDTWQGDEHAGYYSDAIFNKVNAHNQANYAGFSRLLRMTFDDAAAYFADKSIGLLHIDGLHTYEAVKHDFETWLPKLAPAAVVLFHDTNVRERGFGVWKLWEELQVLYPSNIEFLHSHGLGVLQLNDATEENKIEWLEASANAKKSIQNYFASLGEKQLERFEREFHLKPLIAERDGQVAELNQAVAERDGQLAQLNQAVAERDGQINSLLNSRSWRITASVRWLVSTIRNIGSADNDRAPEKTAPASDSGNNSPSASKLLVSPSFEVLSGMTSNEQQSHPAVADSAKVIAFYLPQYHRIAENSEWWGSGFTEWTNVVKAHPNYDGHYQPHLPRELGFYDLSNIEVMREQAEIAKLYGVHAFCFYYYWFSGRRILEKPIDNFLHSDIDINYCLCWANENWTRTWDGDTRSILMEQKYLESDPQEFIASLIPHFRDRRYIRIDGKPMLVVYRAKDIPNVSSVFAIWRRVAEAEGFLGLHIVIVDFYDISRPDEVGGDALVEFPPHKFNGPQTVPDTMPNILNDDFRGGIVDYSKVLAQSANRPQPDFTLYRGVLPSWDNTARRQDTPTILYGSSPDLFEKWLRYIRAYTRDAFRDRSDPFIFVNAWNEWGEGCHLEPDQKWGLAYLEALKRSSWFTPDSATTGSSRQDLLKAAAIAVTLRGLHSGAAAQDVDSVVQSMELVVPTEDRIQKVAFMLRRYPFAHRLGKVVYNLYLRARRYLR